MCAGAVETRHCPHSIFITWIPHICTSLEKLMREFSIQAKHQLHRPENQPPLQHKHTSFTKQQQFGCPYPADATLPTSVPKYLAAYLESRKHLIPSPKWEIETEMAVTQSLIKNLFQRKNFLYKMSKIDMLIMGP